MLYISDVGMHLLHLEHPDWFPIYDIVPTQAQASKRRILNRAADEQALVMGHHLSPFPSLGHVVKKGDGWHWRPIEIIEAGVTVNHTGQKTKDGGR